MNPAFLNYRPPSIALPLANPFRSGNIGSVSTSTGFNLNPSPQTGSGAFGAVPGAIGLPNPSGDLSALYPNLSGTNATISSDIMAKLRGQLSPETINNLRDTAAQFGISSGMPGSGLAQNRFLRDIGVSSENQIESGLRDYASLLPTVSQTQTVNPGLQAEIAGTNASNAAAPNPTQAASYAKELYDEYLKQFGPAGGTGRYASAAGGEAPWWQKTGQVAAKVKPVPWAGLSIGPASPWG